MGFRFRKSFRIAPGLRLNLSGSGASVSIGPRGLKYTIGKKGSRLTAGIPGTGLSWTQYTPHSATSQRRSFNPQIAPPTRTEPADEFEVAQKSNTSPIAIESAPVETISALSTSELVPLLNHVTSRIRLAPIAIGGGLTLIAAALLTQNSVLWAALFTIVVFPAFFWLDRYRRSVSIQYKLTEAARIISDALSQSFEPIRGAQSVWQIDSVAHTNDWKRNAGASQLNQRRKATISNSRPNSMRGDVRFPSISLATESLYFLPDAVLVVSRNSITALDYNDISVSAETVRFIEEGPAPSDAQIVDQTWRYVNKKGGPDRRFNFNKQLPVCLYSEVNLGSAGGLNARLHISDAAAAEPLINVIDIVRQYTSDTSQFRSITSVGPASKWPTILLCSFTIFFGCVVAVQPIISSAQNWVETTRVKGENRSPMLATRNSEQQAVPPLPVADNVARENSAMNFLVPLPKPRPQQRP